MPPKKTIYQIIHPEFLKRKINFHFENSCCVSTTNQTLANLFLRYSTNIEPRYFWSVQLFYWCGKTCTGTAYMCRSLAVQKCYSSEAGEGFVVNYYSGKFIQELRSIPLWLHLFKCSSRETCLALSHSEENSMHLNCKRSISPETFHEMPECNQQNLTHTPSESGHCEGHFIPFRKTIRNGL